MTDQVLCTPSPRPPRIGGGHTAKRGVLPARATSDVELRGPALATCRPSWRRRPRPPEDETFFLSMNQNPPFGIIPLSLNGIFMVDYVQSCITSRGMIPRRFSLLAEVRTSSQDTAGGIPRRGPQLEDSLAEREPPLREYPFYCRCVRKRAPQVTSKWRCRQFLYRPFPWEGGSRECRSFFHPPFLF